jgi:hypothetical protein
MTPRAALLLAALALPIATPAGAQSLLGQSRPGGAQGGSTQAPQTPSTAPLAPVQAIPLPAIVVPTQPSPAPPPPAAGQAQPLPAPQPPPPAATPTPPTPTQAGPVTVLSAPWVSQPTAELRGIDKVTARTTTLTAKMGETIRFGPLTVTIRGCAIRPPDHPADATAFLEVAEGTAAPFFRGWMILSQPQLALIEHPTHDIRLHACRP